MFARNISLFAAGVMLLAACSSSGGTSTEASSVESLVAELKGLNGQQRQERLVELAKAEGTLSLYTSLSGPLAKKVAQTFEDNFGVKVSLYRASSEKVLSRTIQQARAGQPDVDVAGTNGGAMAALNAEGVLIPYKSPSRKGLVEGSAYQTWTAVRYNQKTVNWNTNLVEDGAQPKSWTDLAKPKWDGKIAIEITAYDWFMTLWNYWVEQQNMSPERVKSLFADMARGARFVKGNTSMAQLLSAGEFPVTAGSYTYIINDLVDDGAPVAWQPPVEPVISRPNGAGIVKNAPHPAAAMLYIDWLLSEQGQELIKEYGNTPARASVQDSQDYKIARVDIERFHKNREKWTTRFDKLTTR